MDDIDRNLHRIEAALQKRSSRPSAREVRSPGRIPNQSFSDHQRVESRSESDQDGSSLWGRISRLLGLR